jgi:hypothetical protein
MACIDNLKVKYYAYDEAMKQCLPKVDPKLVHELLQILKTD